MANADEIIGKVVEYYNGTFSEQGRLDDAWGQVEFLRTLDILGRHLPPPPAAVLDVGGAAGRYSCWLAREGYRVHLIDPVPLHIKQAQAASAVQPGTPIAGCELGDARHLRFEAESFDAVLLMGPLYHLTELPDRRQALAEAHRVLKHGGRLFAVGISRFASSIDGLASGFFLDPAFREIMARDLADGQHRNPTGNPAYFTDTFFHHPDELKAEVAGAGFADSKLVAIEGIGYVTKNLEENWRDENARRFLLDLIGRIEEEPSLIGASPHLMCTAVKP